MNPDLDFFIEIHPEDGFLGGEMRFRISNSVRSLYFLARCLFEV